MVGVLRPSRFGFGVWSALCPILLWVLRLVGALPRFGFRVWSARCLIPVEQQAGLDIGSFSLANWGAVSGRRTASFWVLCLVGTLPDSCLLGKLRSSPCGFGVLRLVGAVPRFEFCAW